MLNTFKSIQSEYFICSNIELIVVVVDDIVAVCRDVAIATVVAQ